MFTKQQLCILKQQKLKNVKLDVLIDINKIFIDTTKPVQERILSFLEQIRNPYLFKVGDIPVKIVFSDNSQTIQKQLESIIRQINNNY